VRCLQGAQAGAVVELSAVQYILCRAESCGDNHNPRFEPVPDNEPLHDPILPPNFPSNYQKARRIASRALKKSPDEITLEDCIKFSRGAVNPDTFARMSRHYSEREICEIVWLVASEHLYNITNIGLNIHSDMLCDIAKRSRSGAV
jgi:hypothetical protein